MPLYCTCSVEGCSFPVRTLKSGLCNSHEKRLKRHGSVLGGGTFRAAKAERCLVDGCSSIVYCAGYCSSHYHRNKRHGAPTDGGTGKGALVKWLLDHAQHEGADCLTWPFTGSSDGRGYGHLCYKGKTIGAHRLMCELAHGPAPAVGLDVAHDCGNGHLGCVNPAHLRWATRQQNVQDTYAHGTALIGEKAPLAKLTEEDVKYIRSNQGRVLQRQLAEQFGVSRSLIGAIQNKKRWTHME